MVTEEDLILGSEDMMQYTDLVTRNPHLKAICSCQPMSPPSIS